MVERIIVLHSALDFRVRMEGGGARWSSSCSGDTKGVRLIPGPWVSLRVMLHFKSASEVSWWLRACGAEYSLATFPQKCNKTRSWLHAVYIVTCLHVWVSYRCYPRAHWEEQNQDRPCTDLPPSVISPSSCQTNLICFLPPGDLQNDLVSDFTSSVTSGIFFSSHCLPPPPAQPSNRGNHRSRRHLWPHTILNLTATTSMPLKVCLGATVTSVFSPPARAGPLKARL